MKNEIQKDETLQALNETRVKFLGKKGELTLVLRGMGALSAEERPVIGAFVNEARDEIEAGIELKENELKQKALNEKLSKEKIDITMTINSKKDDKKVIKEKNEKFRMYEDAFSDTIGNKVRISNKKIEISYNSMQDLNRIMEILNINFND